MATPTPVDARPGTAPLRRTPSAPARPAAGADAGARAPLPRTADGCRVLLVEDDLVVRTSLRFALDSYGMEVTEADSVASAHGCGAAEAHAIAIIDLHLPDGRGDQLAAWLRRRQPDLPVVLISTDFDRTPPPRGPTVHLAKPFSSTALIDAISRAAACAAGA